MPDSRFPPIAIVLLLIACFCIYGIILDPGATFAGMDFINLNYPRAFLIKDAFRHGVVPLWNWYEWGGTPLLAALQGAVFYPPTWLALLLPLPYGLQVFVFLHLFAGGCGAALAASHIFRTPWQAAVLCGIIFKGSSFFPGRIEQLQIVAVNCLLPWLVLAVWHQWRSRKLTLWLPVAWSFTLLAGHPQYAVFNLLAAVGLTFIGSTWGSHRKCWRRIGFLATGLGLGSGLAALQLFPTWELGKLSERIWPYPDPTVPELSWTHLPAFVLPQYYKFLTGETGRIFGFTELGIYAGIATIPLALAGLAFINNTRRHQKRLIISAVVIWLLAVVFALGKNGGVASFFFTYVPFFTQTRGAARSLNVATFMLALLAAQGLTAILPRLKAIKALKPQFIAAGLLVLTCGDLALQHYSHLTSILVENYALTAKPMDQQVLKNGGRVYRFMAMDSDLYLNNSMAAVAERHVRLQPNLSSIVEIPLTDGYEEGLLPTRAYANFQRRFNRNLRSDSPDAGLLALMGSNLMFTEYPLPSSRAWDPVSDAFPRPGITPGVVQGQTAQYRYWRSVYNVAMVLDLERLTQSSAGDFLSAAEEAFPHDNTVRVNTQLEKQNHPLLNVSADDFNAATAKGKSKATMLWNRFRSPVDSETTSALVLIKPFPGWKIDKSSSIMQLNSLCSLFYNVQVRADNGNLPQVSLVFAPFSFRLGLFFSFLSFLICAHFLFNGVSRRSKG